MNAHARDIRPAPPPSALFRREALDNVNNEWLGTVVLETKSVYAIAAAISLAIVVAFLLLLAFGSFARTATVSGLLVPQQGLARVFAPQSGTISNVFVKEGDRVKAATPLLAITGEVKSEALVATRAQAIRSIREGRDILLQKRASQAKIHDQQAKDLKQRVDTLTAEMQLLDHEIELQRQRVRIGEDMSQREEQMRARGLIPLPRLQRTQQDELDQTSRLKALERSRLTAQRDLATAQMQLSELPLRRQTELGDIDKTIATTDQELAEAEVRRKAVLTAPIGGTVATLQAEPGGAATPSIPLVSIVPDGAVLQAHLYAPSRNIGFIKAGQRVRLRFQPFPYQKFGMHEGIVASVSQAATAPGELTQALAGTMGAAAANEPLYRIIVDVPKQDVQAYGQAMPLQAGMKVEADVVLERRSLFEWIFDPLYAITGKWS